MTSAVTFVFGDQTSAPSNTRFLSPDPLVAAAGRGGTLRSYGRAVWDAARDEALAWRSAGSGLGATRGAGAPDGTWWGALDGPFEMAGGILDLAYRAHVLSAALADSPMGEVRASGESGDLWLEVLTALCRARGRDLRLEVAPARGKPRGGARGATAKLALRRSWATLRRSVPRADVLLVLTHGGMATRDADGQIVDRYSVLFARALRAAFGVATVSLEPPRGLVAADAVAIARGAYIPWTALVSARDLASARRDRAMWADRLAAADAFAFSAAGVDLGALLAPRALGVAARGIALVLAYRTAFDRALQSSGARAVVATEGHSNVGRAIGIAAPRIAVVAPQAGIIAPDGSTNAAYDHRALPTPSADGSRGCPRPVRSLVWGPYYRDVLLHLGHEPKAVEITGLPRVVIPEMRRRDGHVLFAAGANDDICAFASGFSEEIATIRALRDVLPVSRRVVVRLHPSHDEARYRAALPTSVAITTGVVRPLEADLMDAAAVIGRSSTVLVEAAAAGRAVVVVNLGGAPDLTGLSSAGFSYVDDERDLASVIDRAVVEDRAHLDVASPVGEAAAERVVAAVAEAAR